MVSRLMLAVAFCLMAVAAAADTREVCLGWDPNTEPDIDGYRLYSGTARGGPYNQIGSVKHPTTEFCLQVSGPPGHRTYFVATAVDVAGNESGYSNEVYYEIPQPPDTTPPAPPRGLRVWFRQVINSLIQWLRSIRVG